VLRITARPKAVKVDGKPISQQKSLANDGWTWQPLDKGGVLRIRRTGGSEIVIQLPFLK